MTSKKAFYLMAGLIVLAVMGVGAVVVYGNKLLVQQAGELMNLKTENHVLENQQTELLRAKNDIARYSNLEEITQSIVPQDKDQARAVREIVSLANNAGISIKSITFPTSNLGTTPPAAAPVEGQPAPAQPVTPPLSQAKPVQGVTGVYSLELVIVPAGKVNYYQFIDFLSQLEKNRRTSQVTSIKIDPVRNNSNNPTIDFSLTLNIFVKP
jgi:hypothetical protein